MTDRFRVLNEDPNYKYRWCNNKDLVMMSRIHEGWEPVHGDAAEKLPEAIAKALGQVSPTPGGGSLTQRGDLVLMRMSREAFEANIAGPKREARKRAAATFDTMVQAANENAVRQAKAAGVRIPVAPLVFESSDDRNFGSTPGNVVDPTNQEK